MIRSFFRKLFGTTEIIAQIDELRHELLLLRNDLTVTFRDEFHPDRHAMSKQLGQKMIERLKAEDMARKHTTGEL